MQDKDIMIAGCTDGIRLVVFEIKSEGKQHGQSAAGLINRVSRRVSKEVFRSSVLHSSLLGVTRHYIVSEITARLPVAFLEIKVV